MIQIQLTQDDAALPFINKLIHRERMNVVEVANNVKQLVDILHTTSTSVRPQLNGSSVRFVSEKLNLSPSLISQYMSIGNIRSDRVKQSLILNRAGISKAYYISRVRGKTETEIENLQLSELNRISPGNGDIIHKIKTAQMILKNISGSRSIPFEDVDIQDPLTSAKTLLSNIDKCISLITPNIQKVKILAEQLGYCNFLIIHPDCKCLCGSEIDPRHLQFQKEKIIDEILSMHDQILNEKKYVSLLITARKDLETTMNNYN